jgi:DNA polymerase bacteriophage-type
MLERLSVAPDKTTAPGHNGGVLHRDYETRGVLDLRKVGAHKYAADSRTEVLCCAYAVADDPVQLWLPGDPVPAPFVEAARDPSWVVVAHNDQFESVIERHIMAPRFNFPPIPLERHRCTMAMALALGLPARLERLADALELANRKDAAGQRLMHQLSKPRRRRKDEDPSGTYYFDDPDRLHRLHSYCRQDVEVEHELFEQLPALPEPELDVWILSCLINDRGFRAHREFIAAARNIAKTAAPEIDAELAELTNNVVTGINQVARLLAWLQAQGFVASTPPVILPTTRTRSRPPRCCGCRRARSARAQRNITSAKFVSSASVTKAV